MVYKHCNHFEVENPTTSHLMERSQRIEGVHWSHFNWIGLDWNDISSQVQFHLKGRKFVERTSNNEENWLKTHKLEENKKKTGFPHGIRYDISREVQSNPVLSKHQRTNRARRGSGRNSRNLLNLPQQQWKLLMRIQRKMLLLLFWSCRNPNP